MIRADRRPHFAVVLATLVAAMASTAAAEWYVVCERDGGNVLATETIDEPTQVALEGPLPGPRTASAWIEANCPDRRCTAAGTCIRGETTESRTGHGGWEAGELTTVATGGSPAEPAGRGTGAAGTAPSGAGGDPLAPLVETARSAAGACAYPAALAAANHLTTFDPEHPWLLANHPTVRRLAERQEATEQQVWLAADELERGELERAREHAFAATGTAVSCQTPVVSDLVRGIDTAIEQRRQLRHAQRQRLAAAVLPSLIDLAQVAGGGRPDPETLASTVTSSIQSVAAKYGTVDPCAFRLAYDDPASVLPTCTCPGYRFDASRFRCVP